VFSPRNSALIVTGDIDPKAMAIKLRRCFGDGKVKKSCGHVSFGYYLFTRSTVLLVNKSDATESNLFDLAVSA